MISLRSKITRKILNYFFINQEESLYVNELERKFGLDKRNLVKKLKQLEEERILKSSSRGNLKLYSINKSYPLFNEYKRIVAKTVGFEDSLGRALKGVKRIKEAYVYGSYARDKMDVHSDIDLLVIGGHDIILLQRELNKLQKELDREINVVNMGEQEYRKKVKAKDPFVGGLMKGKKIRII